MKIAVIDGQGGGIGKSLIERLSKVCDEKIEIIALGTNSTATVGMIKAGAHSGATGENAVKVMANQVDIIIGPIAIVITDSMMGEITHTMSQAISTSHAVKVLIPINRCNLFIAGTTDKKLQDFLDEAIKEVNNIISTKGEFAK